MFYYKNMKFSLLFHILIFAFTTCIESNPNSSIFNDNVTVMTKQNFSEDQNKLSKIKSTVNNDKQNQNIPWENLHFIIEVSSKQDENKHSVKNKNRIFNVYENNDDSVRSHAMNTSVLEFKNDSDNNLITTKSEVEQVHNVSTNPPNTTKNFSNSEINNDTNVKSVESLDVQKSGLNNDSNNNENNNYAIKDHTPKHDIILDSLSNSSSNSDRIGKVLHNDDSLTNHGLVAESLISEESMTHKNNASGDLQVLELNSGRIDPKPIKISLNNTFEYEAYSNSSAPINIKDNNSEFQLDDNSKFNYNIEIDENQNNTFIGDSNRFTPSQLDSQYDYYDYYDYEDVNIQNLGTPVRKCCSSNQFFDMTDCADSSSLETFLTKVENILDKTLSRDINIKPGSLSYCPRSLNGPIEKNISLNNPFTITKDGFLIENKSSMLYDHNSYCLELVGFNLEESQLTAIICPIENDIPLVSTRKCCAHDQYFDLQTLECAIRYDNMTDYHSLVSAFARQHVELDVETGLLTCEGTTQKTVTIQDAYLSNGTQLCLYEDNSCYSKEKYCIEDLSEWPYDNVERTAVVCNVPYFHKCCAIDHLILHNNTCGVDTVNSSPLMKDLLHSMNYKIGFSDNSSNICDFYTFDPEFDSKLDWWVDNNGNLIVQSKNHEVLTNKYCIEDFYNGTDTSTIAYACKQDLAGIVPLAIKETSYNDEIGKCCPVGEHLDAYSGNCITDTIGKSLSELIVSVNDNSTKVIFTSFPSCELGYHHYFLESNNTSEDHAYYDEYYNLFIHRLDDGCAVFDTIVDANHYCIDYWVDSEEQLWSIKHNKSQYVPKVAVLICVKDWDHLTQSHYEKYPLIGTCLVISSIALIATIIALATIRVRKGLVTVKKVNTLAGRILLSYVISTLIGFMSLAITNFGNQFFEQHSNWCMAIAGIMLFSLLASFFWNTSICLESLLLTLHVSMSESRRYAIHSVWAWGIPGIVTAVTFIMDANRKQFSCGTILPKIGVYRCFFSDHDAYLLYYYFPITFTLIANIICLISAKLTRQSNLKRLEKGAGHLGLPHKKNSGGDGGSKSPEGGHSSGMRTHQTRNLWAESIRLVMWSGGTWLMEITGFLISRYVSHNQERWHDYIWYIPSMANALRGIGIFVILVLTPENRNRMRRAFNAVAGSARFLSKYSRTNENTSTSAAHMNSTIKMTQKKNYVAKRNMSITSQTTLSSTGRQSVRSDLKLTIHPLLVKPVDMPEHKMVDTKDFSIPETGFNQSIDDSRRRHSLESDDIKKSNHKKLDETKSLKERRTSVGTVTFTDSGSNDMNETNNFKKNLPSVNEEE